MRFTITSFGILLALMLASASIAGHHEAKEQPPRKTPPVEASPPADTPIASPVAPPPKAVPVAPKGDEGAIEDEDRED